LRGGAVGCRVALIGHNPPLALKTSRAVPGKCPGNGRESQLALGRLSVDQTRRRRRAGRVTTVKRFSVVTAAANLVGGDQPIVNQSGYVMASLAGQSVVHSRPVLLGSLSQLPA
jgi:hypothetical protein